MANVIAGLPNLTVNKCDLVRVEMDNLRVNSLLFTVDTSLLSFSEMGDVSIVYLLQKVIDSKNDKIEELEKEIERIKKCKTQS